MNAIWGKFQQNPDEISRKHGENFKLIKDKSE